MQTSDQDQQPECVDQGRFDWRNLRRPEDACSQHTIFVPQFAHKLTFFELNLCVHESIGSHYCTCRCDIHLPSSVLVTPSCRVRSSHENRRDKIKSNDLWWTKRSSFSFLAEFVHGSCLLKNLFVGFRWLSDLGDVETENVVGSDSIRRRKADDTGPAATAVHVGLHRDQHLAGCVGCHQQNEGAPILYKWTEYFSQCLVWPCDIKLVLHCENKITWPFFFQRFLDSQVRGAPAIALVGSLAIAGILERNEVTASSTAELRDWMKVNSLNPCRDYSKSNKTSPL